MATEAQKLCHKAQRGDKEAASAMLNMFYRQIFSYFRQLCGSATDAEDLTQETFIKVWSSLGSYRGRSKVITWIYAIAYHVYVNWLRKKKQPEGRSNQWWQECVADNPGPFEMAAQKQMAERLYEAVEQLDEGKRQVVHLHYYQGLSLRQTGLVLNVAASTVKYRLREVIRILRSELCYDKKELKQKQFLIGELQ